MNEEHALHQLSLDLCLLGGSYKTATSAHVHIDDCPCYSKLKLDNLCWSNNTGTANACHLSSGSGINFQPRNPVEVISIPAMTPEITVVVAIGKWLACFVPTESVFRSSHLQVSEHYEPIPEIYSQDLSKVSSWRDLMLEWWSEVWTTFDKAIKNAGKCWELDEYEISVDG